MPNQTFPLQNFDYILGIDQVGAVNAKGEPKTLPFSFFDCKANFFHWGLNLKALNISEIEKHIPFFKNKRSLIIVDAVLGLPLDKDLTIFEVIARSKKHSGYGLKRAKLFFDNLRQEYKITNYPLREIEKDLKANSVFTPYPFQKNVQTGSFRIYKDLANEKKWFNLLPYENETSFSHYILEGYPSLSFKNLLESSRSEEDFFYLLACMDFKIDQKKNFTLDHIDSAILVLDALSKDGQEIKILKRSEGLIL